MSRRDQEQGGVGVAYAPEFVCAHHHPKLAEYGIRRNDQSGWRAFGLKWGLTQYIDYGGTGLRMFDTGELKYDPGTITQRLAKEANLSEHNSILCRIDQDGNISLSGLEQRFSLQEAREETPDNLGHNNGGGEKSAAAMTLPVAYALPPRIAATLAKAWRRPWKRAYMRICLRPIGVKLRE